MDVHPPKNGMKIGIDLSPYIKALQRIQSRRGSVENWILWILWDMSPGAWPQVSQNWGMPVILPKKSRWVNWAPDFSRISH